MNKTTNWIPAVRHKLAVLLGNIDDRFIEVRPKHRDLNPFNAPRGRNHAG
jgi:hypothetical protein